MTEDRSRPDRDTLVALLRDTAMALGKRSVTRTEFWRRTGITSRGVYRHFKRYADLVRAAGLEPVPARHLLSEDQLFLALREALVAGNGDTTRASFARLGRYHYNSYKSRWGSWAGTLEAFGLWLEDREPEFQYLPALRAALARGRTAPPPTTGGPRDTRCYGPLVKAGGFHHAPVNEQGVVFLFGALAAELGFMVEAVGTGFPDCVAKRRADRGGEVWTRVRIEFEHRSRNFRLHKHPPDSCDLIMCWQHDWPDCPVEVLELRSVVGDPPQRLGG